MNINTYKVPFAAIIMIALAIIFVGIIAFAAPNFSNNRVSAGFAGYNYTNPIFGKDEFKAILIGPNATGFVWREKVALVSVTPYTTMETFMNDSAILGKDKLPIECKASLVYRINTEKVKEFMENWGGLVQTSAKNSDDSADEIMRYAYKNFIEQPFRTAIRQEVSNYNALDASSNLQKISQSVLNQIRSRFSLSPYVIDDVAIGETNPPKQIVESVIAKVKATQDNERKSIELEIEQKNIQIQKAKGEAEGALKFAIAKQEANAQIEKGNATAQIIQKTGEAESEVIKIKAITESEAIRLKNNAMGENYLRSLMYEKMLNNAKIYLPTDSNGKTGFPFFGIMNMNENEKK